MTTQALQTRPADFGWRDEEAIRQIVTRFIEAWNDGDSGGLSALFAEDADFINVLGAYDRGRAAIAAVHQYLFDTVYRGSRNRYTVEHIRALRPDAAIAFCRACLTYFKGGETGEVHARPTMVLAKEDGEWRIIAFQNTTIAAPSARSGADL